ncbi:hypothetical protein, partial [Kocuria rhizophila]
MGAAVLVGVVARGGGLVVGARLRGAPVQHEPAVVLGVQPEPAHVVPFVLRGVPAAEHEPLVHGVEPGEPVLVVGGE